MSMIDTSTLFPGYARASCAEVDARFSGFAAPSRQFRRPLARIAPILLFLFSAFSLSAQVVGEFVGTLTMGWIDKTNIYSVSLLSSSSNWDLTLSYSNVLRETFYDGTQTVWITHFPQNSNTNKSENTVQLKLFPDSRPVDVRVEEHVWMALFSHTSLVGQKTPLPDIGLCISEPCVFTRLESKTRSDVSPREALWHNTRSDSSKTEKIGGEFKWGAWTNLQNGLVVPTESELTISIGSKVVTYSKLVLTEINALKSKPRQGPSFTGSGLVFDYRTGDIEHRQRSEYLINSDRIPPINDSIVKNPRRIINLPAKPEASSKSLIRIVFAIFLLLSVGFFVVVHKLKNKQQR